MDNREFAKVLLCEATELLNEATRYDKEMYNKGEKNSKYWGEKAAKEEAIGRQLMNKSEELKDQANKTKWYKPGVKKDLRNKADEAENKSMDKYSDAHTSRYNGRVAARSKSQNESIAILLTEAALLLNESVGVKDRSTDKVVKIFNTNKEATDWIIANGGNDRYQLTNKLK